MNHIIGIDLGTTNSTLASVSFNEQTFNLVQHHIVQMDADGAEKSSFFLPSFLLFPPRVEFKEKYIIGQYARERGQELPKRVVASAKSWLSCFNIDRRERFLPLSDKEDEDIEKLSPIEVTSAFLQKIQSAWQQTQEKDLFNEQKIIVTVPASFDPSARQLVMEAAKNANYPDITLMEEPLAAFYAWLGVNEKCWRQKLKIHDRVLIVDIGGGTTDFTMITVNEKDGDLSLERTAVGSHLLLGGDNIDLALAYYTKTKLEKEGNRLDTWQFQSLIMQARKAKEVLLTEECPKKVTLLIESKGSSLIGGSITIDLTQEEVHELLIDGFFPLVAFEEEVLEYRKSAISKFGLPYARDARITAHLAAFINHSCQGKLPTKVLFNGGTMKSLAFQKWVLDQLTEWATKAKEREVDVLAGADLDFAVSKGAVYYGWTKEKGGIRVKAGTSRSYFIGVERGMPAVPGVAQPLNALCIVPFGMEEGSEVFLSETFTLIVGEPTSFQFFASCSPTLSDGSAVTVGTLVEEAEKELIEFPPIETLLSSQGVDTKIVNVKLHAKVTEMGMLELWCEGEDDKQWKLEFNLRTEDVCALVGV